jgi:hypothetical protein
VSRLTHGFIEMNVGNILVCQTFGYQRRKGNAHAVVILTHAYEDPWSERLGDTRFDHLLMKGNHL